jgi:hypothetical protein
MKLSSLPIAAFAISILLASSSPVDAVDARPVTTADLAGKIICWGDGNIQAFSADGKTANRQFQDGAWSVGDKGVRIDFPGGGADVDIEIQPDGTFTNEWTDSGGTHKGTGNICKAKLLRYADVAGKKLCWSDGSWDTFSPDGKFIDSEDGEGTVNINGESAFSEWRFKKFDKVFKGKTVQLEDGTVVSTGSFPGNVYAVGTAVFCK